MTKKGNQLFIHILGCVSFLALPVLFSPDLSSDFNFIAITGFKLDFIFHAFLILFFYLNYFYLIPQLYFQKKHFIFFSINALSFFLILLLPLLIIPPNHFQLVSPPKLYDMPSPFGIFLMLEIRPRFFQFLIVFIFSLMLKINSRLKRSEKEKLSAELSYLKAQINPHFLFNTLNGIYSLALEKSENVAASIVKLSNMMRYMLNESSNDFVSLEKEIEYIQNYIEFQKIRFGTVVQMEFLITGNQTGQSIAPLILIPFIENAYKHGVNAEDNSLIKIRIDIADNRLCLTVKNNKVYIYNIGEIKSGLGIENAKNRLQFTYPKKYKLTIEDTEEEYSVSLILQLK